MTKKESVMKEENKIEVKMVYLGERTNTEGKRFYAWAEVDQEEGPLEWVQHDEAWFPRVMVKGKCVPGAMAIFETDGQTYKAKEMAGFWHDRGQALQWQTESRVTRLDRARKNRERKEKNPFLFSETLDPIRQVYKKMGPTKRSQLLAELIRYITT